MPRTSSADVAYINPKILTWAIKTRGIDRDSLASKVSTSTESLLSWEEPNGSHPPFRKAQQLAKHLRIPFGYFFLSEPPNEELPVADMRSRRKFSRPSAEFRDVLTDALLKQDWYRDYLKDRRRSKLRFVGAYTMKSKAEDIAADIRGALGITAELRRSVQSSGEYLNTFTRAAEEQGVIVLRNSVVGHNTSRPLDPDEVQGFALADPIAPMVFVNTADAKNAQLFTLAHELAHIWLGQSAVDDARPDLQGKNKVELFCNAVAAEVLAPSNEFLRAWDRTPSVGRVRTIARQFWVSAMTVIVRAFDLERISQREYDNLMAAERAVVRQKKDSTGGDFYRSLVVRMSARFTATVIGEVNRNSIQLKQAAKLLGLSGRSLVKYAEMSR